ncbi:hypothetical protein CTI12_AA565140 [Artemisia annua]|uniref:Auxin-responsive protein n=1 Tax=Artemisia annua TaxID=35608 RepID=A0A2U1KTZ3_ARTAN|nr:hypothetical protein CTI12_AA565140 [Artemisia annua]
MNIVTNYGVFNSLVGDVPGEMFVDIMQAIKDHERLRCDRARAQVVGWSPTRSFWKNTMATNSSKNVEVAEGKAGCGGYVYVKVSMDGAPYLRKYEDKDGDWMLVGDVPWKMFVDSCKRLRIMKGSEAIGLAPRSMEKCKNQV